MKKKISDSIFLTAKKENEKLIKLLSTGIFFMPELAFTYKCGIDIMENVDHIFGKSSYTWKREKEFKNYGFADMVFEPADKNDTEVVMEFKMDNTWNEYERDINKLRGLQDSERSFRKFFCSLKWVFDKKQSEYFLKKLHEELEAQFLYMDMFRTIVRSPDKEDNCLITFWEVT